MDLKEFVRSVLVQINEGVDLARKEASRDIQFSGKDQKVVEFDIAVSVEDSSSSSAGGGIRVLELVKAEGGTATENKNSTVSRIKFSVHIEFLTKEELKQDR